MRWRILNMDALLELLGRYDYHLKRSEKAMIDFLNYIYMIYVKRMCQRKIN